MREIIKTKSQMEFLFFQTNFKDELNRNSFIVACLSIMTLLAANVFVHGEWGNHLWKVRLIWVATICLFALAFVKAIVNPKMISIWTESNGIAVDTGNDQIFARIESDKHPTEEVPIFKDNQFECHTTNGRNYVCTGRPSREMIEILYMIAHHNHFQESIYPIGMVCLCIDLDGSSCELRDRIQAHCVAEEATTGKSGE